MEVELYPDKAYKAVVTFENLQEHYDFCNRTPRWNRLFWRQYILDNNPDPFFNPFDVALKAVTGGEPALYPHQEVVSLRTLSHVAGKLLLAQAHSKEPDRQAKRQQVLTPILDFFASTTG